MGVSTFGATFWHIPRALVLLGCLALSGCRDFQTEKQVGGFVIRSHVRQYIFSWENNTELRYEEYCRVADGSCFIEDGALKRSRSTVVEFSEPHPGAMVAIISNNINGRLEERPQLRIFETAGKELKCRDCSVSEIWPSDVLQSYWRGNGIYFLHTHDAHSDGLVHVFWIASVIADEFKIRRIKEIRLRDSSVKIKRPSLSENGRMLAWLFCDEDCELVVLTVENGEENTSSVDCPRSTDPKIRWGERSAFYLCD